MGPHVAPSGPSEAQHQALAGLGLFMRTTARAGGAWPPLGSFPARRIRNRMEILDKFRENKIEFCLGNNIEFAYSFKKKVKFV
jgi:hypothetical protein